MYTNNIDLNQFDEVTQYEIKKLIKEYESICASIRSQRFNNSRDELLNLADTNLKQNSICGIDSTYWRKYKAILLQDEQNKSVN